MAKPVPTPDDDVSSSTLDIIFEARRPLLIQRHRMLVEEMELSLSDSFITGDLDNPRLQALHRDLDSESEQARVAKTLAGLIQDPHYADGTLRESLIDELCLLRENGSIEIATLQMHVIGVYRDLGRRLCARLGQMPSLAELRPMPVAMVSRLLNPIDATFGSASLAECLVYTPAYADRALESIKRIRKAVSGDTIWQDADHEPSLSRQEEEPLLKLPEVEREAARSLVVQDHIRRRFYRAVFLDYFNCDEFDPRDADAWPNLLAWLEAIESTPHLFPFMQGQTNSQKVFRLSRLQQKLVQLHEVYARLDIAAQHPTHREEFVGMSVRERLAVLAKTQFPPLPMTNELKLATLLCPFGRFVEWVQSRTAEQAFVLPPDPKR